MPEASDTVVLLSGGLDSATVLALALAAGRRPVCLSFRYGQRHEHELRAAARLAAAAGVEHLVCGIDLGVFGGSALTDASIDVPHGRPADEISAGIPVTYVPARNTVFLSFALALAEVRGAREIHIGVNAIDYSGYPDCRPEFIAAYERMANLATRAGVEGRGVHIVAPLQDLSKAEIVRRGLDLGVDYGQTHSCYDPSPEGEACGTCDACQLRLAAFAELGVEDPAAYRR